MQGKENRWQPRGRRRTYVQVWWRATSSRGFLCSIAHAEVASNWQLMRRHCNDRVGRRTGPRSSAGQCRQSKDGRSSPTSNGRRLVRIQRCCCRRGTDPKGVFHAVGGVQKVAFLHLDPARPRNSRTHALEEMQPSLSAVLEAWAPFFEADKQPALLLDLSPRLTDAQRHEVEQKVEAIWPGVQRTWEWTSRGRGRVDRLALWLGGVASAKVARRFVRVPPSLSDRPVVLETAEHPSGQEALRHPPQRGEFVSILDAALMESGLMEAWLKGVLPGSLRRWGVVSGRRPQLHHDRMLDLKAGDQWLVQASGRVVEVMLVPRRFDGGRGRNCD